MVLRGTGLIASSTVLAGCIDDSSTDTDLDASTGDGSGDEEPRDTESNGSDGSRSDGDAGADGADADTGADTDDGDADETESDGDGTDSSATNHTFEIEPGTEVLFGGQTFEWEGLEPLQIEGVSNPTLVLEAGETYTIGWAEGNGSMHNIAIWNDDEEVVNGLETELVTDPGEEQTVTFTADEAMTLYVCHPHNNAGMRGSIEVRTGE